MKKPHLLGVVLASTLLASTAQAVTYNFTGSLSFAGGLPSDLHTSLPVGTTFSGSYSVDRNSREAISSLVDEFGNPVDESRYTVDSFSIDFGGEYLNMYGAALSMMDGYYTMTDPEGNVTYPDAYQVFGVFYPGSPVLYDTNIVLSDYTSSTLSSSYRLNAVKVYVWDNAGTLLDGTFLPAGAIDPDLYRVRFELAYQLTCCTGTTYVYGNIDSMSVAEVPIPAAAWLFLSGLAPFAMRARRRVEG